MSRTMADSISLANLPAGFDLYAGYDDGNWPDAAAIASQFPNQTVIRITVFPWDHFGDCLDVESGDATPQQAPGWVANRRQAGHGGPLVYCSWSLLPTVQAAFADARVAPPGYWVAGYPAPDGDAIPPGTVGHQWIDRGPYDESIMVDYLPGIDATPPPVSPPIIYPGDNVQATNITFAISGGHGWAPSPVPAAKVVNAVPFDENPEAVGRYDNIPLFNGFATQPSKDAPNGALVFVGGADGTHGATVWSVT